jgi:hypothetical protein
LHCCSSGLSPSNYLLSSSEGRGPTLAPTAASGNFVYVFLVPQSRNGPTAGPLLGIQADLTLEKSIAVRSILREIVLFSCMALFITGIVVALASLLI